jgi:hypothetical protein
VHLKGLTPKRPTIVALLCSWLLVASFALATLPAHAQVSPVDILIEDRHAALEALPHAPSGYRRDQRGSVIWDYPESTRDTIRELQDGFADQWDTITQELGGQFDDQLTIRIARSPEEMRMLAPPQAPPPAYAVGVAYPTRGLILLTLSAPRTWERPNLSVVLAHELSHIALHRAARGAQLPRWFMEGVAIHQADEHSLERLQALWAATYHDELIPLRELSGAFPEHAHEVNLAYAQSADVVGYLADRGFGGRRFRRLMRRLRAGDDFEEAMMRAFYTSMTRLEREWKADANKRFSSLPIILGFGPIWMIAVLLVIVAWFRARKRKRLKLAEWEREEAAWDRIGRILRMSLSRGRSETDGDEFDPDLPTFLSDAPPEGRSTEVPTVDVQGHDHTLH